MGMTASDPPSDKLSGEKLARSWFPATRVRDLKVFYAPKKGKNGWQLQAVGQITFAPQLQNGALNDETNQPQHTD